MNCCSLHTLFQCIKCVNKHLAHRVLLKNYAHCHLVSELLMENQLQHFNITHLGFENCESVYRFNF